MSEEMNQVPLGRRVGLLGGGQLGRMMAPAAHRMGLDMTVLDPGGLKSPAGQLTGRAIEGHFNDPEKVQELVSGLRKGLDVLTMEIEHVSVEGLLAAEKAGIDVQPSSGTIGMIQDKYLQKEYLAKNSIPLPDYMLVDTVADITRAAAAWGGYPLMLKSRKLAYDGRGNAVVKDAGAVQAAFESLGGSKGAGTLYVERWADFVKEIAVMVARSTTGELKCYPVVETVQRDNICHTVTAPANISEEAEAQAIEISTKAIASFDGAGVFGVELFLLTDGKVVLNEIAPRPHNSGHYTIEACHTDQFEQHLRAVLGLPLGDCGLKVGCSQMINILGTGSTSSTLQESYANAALRVPGATVHWYGKEGCRKGRKMGHLTVVAPDVQTLHERLALLKNTSSSSAASNSTSEKKEERPVVGICMGSDSDLPCMQATGKILDDFGVPYELTIVSAHRTPLRMVEYAKTASKRGIKVIVAGAGGAAHLPGMVAALTALPVIGVPIKTSTLSGVDSLYSIVQMPRGVPVATVAIGNAKNAGLLAVRILGAYDTSLRTKLEEFAEASRVEVMGKAEKLEKVGYAEYLKGMGK